MTRLPTGVPGLDVVLGGGLQPGSVTVLAGAPGTGKTIMAQQICFANATTAHRAVYYTTLSEPHSKLVRHLAPFSFFAPEKLGPEVEYIHLGDRIRSDQHGQMEPLISEVMRKTMEEQPVLVVIDSAKALRDFAGERELRLAFYDLTSRMAHTNAALLLFGEYTPEEMAAGVEFSLADSIIQLAYEPREPVEPALGPGDQNARNPPTGRQAHLPHHHLRSRGLPPHRDPRCQPRRMSPAG